MVLRGTAPDETERLRLGSLLHRLRAELRVVTYAQAERDCAQLAAELVAAVPELREARFEAIPRGGLIVLGMLSYLLDLRVDQLAPRHDPERLLVLVDDCAFTGLRARQALAARSPSRAVIAHLYSPPPLRRALAREPGVTACVAARDLRDETADALPALSERHSRETRWRERLGDRPWYGLSEPVVFPWNEPDSPFWNSLAGRAENGWRLIAPHRNLKARGKLGDPELLSPGREAGWGWRLAEGVAWGDFDGVIWLCRLADRQVFSLTDVAADLWRWTAAGGSEPAVAARAAEVYSVDAERIRRDMAELFAELTAEGLMERWTEGVRDDE